MKSSCAVPTYSSALHLNWWIQLLDATSPAVTRDSWRCCALAGVASCSVCVFDVNGGKRVIFLLVVLEYTGHTWPKHVSSVRTTNINCLKCCWSVFVGLGVSLAVRLSSQLRCLAALVAGSACFCWVKRCLLQGCFPFRKQLQLQPSDSADVSFFFFKHSYQIPFFHYHHWNGCHHRVTEKPGGVFIIY